MKPHLLNEVRNGRGDVVISYKPQVIAEPEVSKDHLKLVRDSLHGVVMESESMKERFDEFGVDAAGKTGTAEVAGKDDYGLFVCYAPFNDPKYVVSVLIEQGRGGATAASPIGAAVMASLLNAEANGYSSADIGRIAGSSGKYKEPEHSNEGRTD